MKRSTALALVLVLLASAFVVAALTQLDPIRQVVTFTPSGGFQLHGGKVDGAFLTYLQRGPTPGNLTTYQLFDDGYETGEYRALEPFSPPRSATTSPDALGTSRALGFLLDASYATAKSLVVDHWLGAKDLLVFLLDSLTMNARAVNCNVAGGACFWVGGTGNFSDGTHWSNSSGGANCGCTPTTTSTLTFDASSGTGTATQNNATFTSAGVTMDNSTATVSGSSNTWNVGGNWSDINGKFSFSTSTIIANATGSWNMKGAGDQGNQHFYIWEVANGVTATLSQSLGAGQVIMLGTSTITGSSKSITVGTGIGGTTPFQCLSTSTVSVGIQYNNSTANTVVATACSYAAGSSSFSGALRLNASITFLLSGALTITSTLGLYITDANGATVLNTQNNTITDSGPLVVDDAGGGLAASLTAGTSAISATSFTLGGAADHDGSVTSNGTWTISGAITGYGTWTANGSTLKVAGSFAWSTANGATFTYGTSTIEFTATGTLTLPTGNGNATSYNITIDASVTMTVGARTGIQNALVVNGTINYNSTSFDIRGANTTPITFGASGTQSGAGTLSFIEDGTAATITISAHTDYPSIRFEPVTSSMLYVLNGTTTFAGLDFLIINTGSTLSTQNNAFNTGAITTTTNGPFGVLTGTSTVTTGSITLGTSIYFTSSAGGSWSVDLSSGNYTNGSTSSSWAMSAPVTFISTGSRTLTFCGTSCGGGTEFLGNVTLDQKTGGVGITYTMGAALSMGVSSNPGLTLTVQRSVGTGSVTLTTSASNFAITTSSVVVSANAVLTANASTITVQSAGVTNTGWSTSAGTFNAGTSTVILFCNGSVSTVVGSTSVNVFYNLTWQSGNSLVLSTSTSVSNVFTVSSSGSVNAGSGPTVYVNTSSATPIVWSTSRIFANVYLNATTAYTLPTNGTYGGNLTVGGSATATLGAALLMDGANHASTLTIQDTATLNTSASNFAITLSTGVVGITVGTGATLVPNTSTISLTGSWDSSGGTVNAANFGTPHNQYTANFNGTGAYTIKTGDAVGGFGNGGNETFWNLNINSGTSVTLLLTSFGVYASNSIYVNAPIIAGSPYASVSFWGIFTSACKLSECVTFGPSANMQQSGFFSYIPNSWTTTEQFHITPGNYNSLEINAVCNSLITSPIDCANPKTGSQVYLDGNITMLSNGTGFTDGEFILRTAQSFAMFDFYQNGFNVTANGDVFVGDTSGASVRYHVGTGTLRANDGLAPIGPAILYMDSGTVIAYPVTVYAPVALYLNYDSGYSATIHGGTGTLSVHGKLRYWTNGGNNASVIYGESATINVFADQASGAYGLSGDVQIDDAPGWIDFGSSTWNVYGVNDTTADFRTYSTSTKWSCPSSATVNFLGAAGSTQTYLGESVCLPSVVVALGTTLGISSAGTLLNFVSLVVNGTLTLNKTGDPTKTISATNLIASTDFGYVSLSTFGSWDLATPYVIFPAGITSSIATLTLTIYGLPSSSLVLLKDNVAVANGLVGAGKQTWLVHGGWSTHTLQIGYANPNTGPGLIAIGDFACTTSYSILSIVLACTVNLQPTDPNQISWLVNGQGVGHGVSMRFQAPVLGVSSTYTVEMSASLPLLSIDKTHTYTADASLNVVVYLVLLGVVGGVLVALLAHGAKKARSKRGVVRRTVFIFNGTPPRRPPTNGRA